MNKIIQILRKTDQYLQFTCAVTIAILLLIKKDDATKNLLSKLFLRKLLQGQKSMFRLVLSHRNGILFQKIV